MQAEKLLELISKSTKEDLESVDKEMAAVESKLSGLKMVRKLIASNLGLSQRKSSADKSQKKEVMRKKAAAFLLTNGPTELSVLSKHLGLNGAQGLHHFLDADWFEKSGGRYSLTNDGRSDAISMGLNRKSP